MSLQFDYNNALDQIVGTRHGLTIKQITSLNKRAKTIHARLREQRASGALGFYDLPYDTLLAKAIEELAAEIKKKFDYFVLFGIGGSGLGPICLHTALTHPYHNLLPRKTRKGIPQMFFIDNADPEMIAALEDAIVPEKTLFNVITKSGTTAETMTAFYYFYSKLQKKIGKTRARKHFVVTTEKDSKGLGAIAEKEQLRWLPVPKNVGGRFSVFSSVGLLPAAVDGINIRNLLAGARRMSERCARADLRRNPAYLNAAIHYLASLKKGKSISVMMAYGNALYDVADWYRQLWAESLGKKYSLEHKVVNVGQTPVKALGATDQHSQVQLYAEGPNDKLFTFLHTLEYRKKRRIPSVFKYVPELAHYGGAEFGDLLNKEFAATEFALARANRPSVRITLERIDEFHIGELLFMLEVQTAFSGGLLNINPFDQPGVEEGKRATHALMGRQNPEDEQKRDELKKYEKRRRYKCL